MRKLATLILLAAALLVACGGSSSTDLFGDPLASSDLAQDPPREEDAEESRSSVEASAE